MDAVDKITDKNFILTALIIITMVLIFVIDLQFATDIAAGVTYVLVVLLSLWLPSYIYTIIFAALCTTLVIIGCFISVYQLDNLEVPTYLNRGFTLFAIWVTTIIAIYRKKISAELQEREILYKAILNASLDPIIILDNNGKIESANSASEKTFGWNPDELIGKMFAELLYYEDRSRINSILNNTASLIEVNAMHRIKKKFPCELSINFVHIPKLKKSMYTVMLRDISPRKNAEEKLLWLSMNDGLTKIYNRRYFNEQLDKEWFRLMRTGAYLSIILLDVDFFKRYNDTLGHQAGDSCLQMLASTLKSSTHRAGDFVARYGGEEFIFLLPNTNIDGAKKVADLIQQKLDKLFIPHPTNEVSDHLTVSMGIASAIPTANNNSDQLLQNADSALYQAKSTGRDKYCIYQEDKS